MSQLQETSPRAGASGVVSGGGGGGDFYTHQIANSCRFGVVNSYLTRSISGVTDNTQNTISFWVKRSKITGSAANGRQPVMGNSGGAGQLEFEDDDTFRYASYGTLQSSAHLFRDSSAWYHFYIYRSTSNGSGAIYVNGVQVSLTTNTAGSAGIFQNGQSLQIGASNNGSTVFDGYIADVYGIYNQNIAPTVFGEEKNGVWIPKDASSAITFGSHDFHLKFESSSDLGNDSSGNNNDFTATNMSAHDQTLDSPTFNSDSNGGNFNTLNAIDKNSGDTGLINGALTLTSSGSGRRTAFGTMGVSTGKWYFESRQINDTSSNAYPLGIQRISEGLQWKNWTHYVGSAVSTYGYSYSMYNKGGGNTSEKVYNDSWVTLSDIIAGVAGTIYQIAFDLDANKIWMGANGTWTNSGNPATGANPTFSSIPSGTYASAVSVSNTSSSDYFTHNYGADGTFAGTRTAGGNKDSTGYGNFTYAPPTDFLALCTGNLPTADAIDPAQTDDDYPQKLFSPILWAGSGSGDGVPKTNTITGLGFKPDYVNIKERTDSSAYALFDSSRGNTKLIAGNLAQAEVDQASLPALVSFDTDGFKAQYPNTGNYYVNRGNKTYVAWCQRANGGSLTTNNVGNQTSYTQTDPSGGFSITKYAGTGSSMTVGHGLSVEPKLTIIKDLTASQDWVVYTKVIDGSMDYFVLNSGAAKGDSGLTGPNSSVWTWNSGSGFSNTASRNYIMYNFANIEGYCKTGIYTGNASTNGVFVNTGFAVSWLMIKRVNGVESWFVMDDKRDTYNVVEGVLQQNGPNGESTTDYDVGDFLSNGFKLRISGVGFNGAEQYIYQAFAENPFQYATAR